MPRQTEIGPEQAIVFFKKGVGRQVEINLQDAGQQISISKTDIYSLKSRRDFRR